MSQKQWVLWWCSGECLRNNGFYGGVVVCLRNNGFYGGVVVRVSEIMGFMVV